MARVNAIMHMTRPKPEKLLIAVTIQGLLDRMRNSIQSIKLRMC